MGAAGRLWDEAKHPRAHGKFAKKSVDVSERRNQGVRSGAAFHPRPSATERRALKEAVPAEWRSAKAIYDKRDRGGRLTYKEEQAISWQSPRKMAEQRAKTGDAIVPRGEASTRLRSHGPNRSGEGRLGNRDQVVRNPRTGKLQAQRDTRDVVKSDGRVVGARRARRAFDLRPKAAKTPATPARPAYDTSQFPLYTDAKLRELATSLGLALPKRAGRNQIIKLIQGA